MLRWISSWMLALAFCGAASAQIGQPRITPQPSLNDAVAMDFVHDVRVGAASGRLSMRYNPRRSGPVTATLLGVAVDGFYFTEPASAGAQPARSLVLLRRENGAIVQAITADYDYTARNWFGLAHWLASGANQGSAEQNAVGFRTVSTAPRFCRRGQNCTPDTTLPTVSVASTPFVTAPLAGVNATVGTEAGPLVFRRADDGVLSGQIWAEDITGHYAAPAGTVVFLRMRNGHPFQIWRGVLDAAGGSSGRGFPLDATAGAPFAWATGAQDQLVTGVRSIYSRRSCAGVDNPGDGAGAFVNMFNCTDDLHEAWLLFRLTTDRFALASTDSGLCLHLSETRGERLVQQPCRGGPSQELQINRRILDAQGNVLTTEYAHTTADFAAASYFTIFGSPARGVGSTECMGVQPSQSNIITLTCLEDKGYWTGQ